MKTKLSLIGLCVSLNCLANEVDLTVTNGGTVNYSDSSCTESCKIDTSDSDVVLTPSNSDTLLFSSWSGQSCDFGKGGTFSSEAKRISNPSGGAKTLQVLDINNDGNADLFGISLFSGTVTQSINKGDGEFETKTVIQDLTYPAALDSYDWNGDGYEDLLVSDFGNVSINVYLNDGNGALTLSEEIKVSGIRPYAFSVFESEGVDGPQLIISSFSADTTGNLSQLVTSIREAKTAIYAKDGSSFKETRVLSEQAGIPPGVFNVIVSSDSRGVGEVLTTHADVDKFTFTGSTQVGKSLIKQCASSVKKVSMELGGNAPFIVFDDADIDSAVKGAIAS